MHTNEWNETCTSAVVLVSDTFSCYDDGTQMRARGSWKAKQVKDRVIAEGWILQRIAAVLEEKQDKRSWQQWRIFEETEAHSAEWNESCTAAVIVVSDT